MRWASCYQPDIYTNMETNNYVLSWHNQLKMTYLKRKPNKRVDRLIYVLVHDVGEDYELNVKRLLLKLGRMGPEERRRRQLNAEKFAMEVIPDMNQSINPCTYTVQSFTDSNISYEIEVGEQDMISCNCRDFIFNRNALTCITVYKFL
ncbi:hypothetical protein BDF21DRAFT_409898 [Thamnidium elegans]|nr:hypothetical protein BDF21DRAFT_409898 [Thamnidium elegans]